MLDAFEKIDADLREIDAWLRAQKRGRRPLDDLAASERVRAALAGLAEGLEQKENELRKFKKPR